MKKRLFLNTLLTLLILAGHDDLKAQVTNGGSYILEVNHWEGYGRMNTDPTTVGEQTHTGVAVLNNTPVAATNRYGEGGSCAVDNTDSNRWFDIDKSMGLLQGSTNGYFDISFRSWEDDGGNSCAYDNDDDSPGDLWGSRYATGSGKNQSEWFEHPQVDLVNNSSEKFRSTWRYTNGTKASPLDFGTLGNGTKSHVNTNVSAPPSADASLGYSDEWTVADGFQDGNDVTYKFVVPTGTTKRVTVSIDNAISNAGIVAGKVFLANSNKVKIAEGSNGQTSHQYTTKLTKDLCPGTYYVVVDGWFSGYKGAFKLEVTSSDLSVTPGTIAISTSNPSNLYLCPDETIPPILSASLGTSTLPGSVTYKWFRATYNNGTWSSQTQYTPAGTGATASNLGIMGANQVVGYYRVAYDCGTLSTTPFVYFRRHNVTLNAGTITGTKTVPFPHEQSNGSIGSFTNASSSPSQVILWQKSTDDGGSWSDATGSNSGQQSYTLPDSISQTTTFRRKISNACDGVAGYNGVAYSGTEKVTIINPNGVISGRVKSPSGAGVSGVTITAVRTSSPPAGGIANKTYTTTTTSNGNYSFTNNIPPEALYYGSTATGSGSTATFRVTPSKGVGTEAHVFKLENSNPRQENKDAILTQIDPNAEDIVFIDETVFAVTGTITQECADCEGKSVGNPAVFNLADVSFEVTDPLPATTPYPPTWRTYPTLSKTITGGTYSLTFDEQGEYRIKPEYENHIFVDSVKVLTLGAVLEVPNINFKDTTTHVISGTLRADCDQDIGQADLTFTQVLPDDASGNPVLGVFIKKVTTTAGSGAYAIRLPAAKYKVTVTGFTDIPTGEGFDLNEMVTFFDVLVTDEDKTRDILTEDKVLNLTFKEAPQIKAFSGLTGPCTLNASLYPTYPDLSDSPIFAQGKAREFTIKVFQGDPSKQVTYKEESVSGCPVDDANLKITTNVHQDDGTEEFNNTTTDGAYTMSLTGGEPNILAAEEFIKTLSIDFTDIYGREAPGLNLKPVVTGVKTSVGSFTTVSPEIPFLILRDPPGDRSFSFRETNSTTETAISFSTKRTNSKDVWIDAKLGTKFEAGLGVSYESAFWGSLKGSFAQNTVNTSSTEAISSISNSQYYSTANDEDIVGEKGDLFVGAAVNFLYAPIIEVLYSADTCSFYLKKDYIMAPDGFATTYSYTEGYIREIEIPKIKGFRDNPSNTANQTRAHQRQIDVWEQTLERNRQLKKRATFNKNISFDGGSGPQTSTITTSSTDVSTIQFEMETDSSLAAEVGMELGGSGLAEGGTISLRMETGKSKTNTVTSSTTTGFTIDDGDVGDYFSIDIKNDPVYNTPVFDLVAGASSCPNEAGTQQRDQFNFTAADPVLSGIPADGQAIYKLNLGNTSQSEQARTYYVRYLPSSSTGVSVIIEGLGAGPYDYPLNYLQSKELTVGVSRFDPNIFSFEGMRFEAFDACGYGNSALANIKKELQISAFFENACSPITLALPEDSFVMNSTSGNILPIKMTDYVHANLNDISLEYAKDGTSPWITAFTRTKAQIVNSAFGTTVNWDITNLADGKYNLRLKLKCGAQIVYSRRATGVIDRNGPELFGTPEPADDAYVLGDEISATFTEELSCGEFNDSNFTLTRMSNSSVIPATLGCFQNKIIITPTSSITTPIGDSIKVNLVNIKDKYGNPSPTSFEWEFRVGTPRASAITNTAVIAANTVQISEDASGTIDFTFTLSEPKAYNVTINYSVSGEATSGTDYGSSGQKTNLGYEGSVMIPMNTVSKIVSIDPSPDTDVEGDELVILSIQQGGDYVISTTNNKAQATILNDDVAADDCLNAGSPYLLSNNNGGSSALTPGTYHKLLLESNAKVISSTTIVLKGEKSVILNPGFSVENGSIFTATLEDCPNVLAVGNFNASSVEAGNSPASDKQAEQSVEVTVAPNTITQTLAEDGTISIGFTNLVEQELKVELFSFNGKLIEDLTTAAIFKIGTNEITVNTQDLSAGTYYVVIQGEPTTTYYRLVITD